MTIITGREFRSNQSKYIGLAHRGERVVISSKSGYAELTPVSKEDKEVKEHLNAKAFLAVSSRKIVSSQPRVTSPNRPTRRRLLWESEMVVFVAPLDRFQKPERMVRTSVLPTS